MEGKGLETRHSRLFATLVLGSVRASGSVRAQKADFVRNGAPVPPTPAASTDTIINYAGGVPAFYPGSFDAQDSTYNRCVSCATLSGVGTAVPYDTITINNVSAAVANIIVFSTTDTGAACTDTNDTFFTLYNTRSTRRPRSRAAWRSTTTSTAPRTVAAG